MKNLIIVTKVAIVLCILVFLLTIADFMAFHDIRNDYVGTKVIEHLEIVNSEDLPEWTRTPMEWQMTAISFVSRFFFFIFNTILLFVIIRKFGQIKKQQVATGAA